MSRRAAGLVMGIGNELRGDDAAGMEVARIISRRTDLPVILAGEVPENYLGLVRSFDPEWVLLTDAVDFGSTPGDTAIFRLDGPGSGPAKGPGPSTHRSSLSLSARYLATETGAEVWLLGIQPKSVDFGQPMSPAVGAAVEPAARLAETWAERRSAAMEA